MYTLRERAQLVATIPLFEGLRKKDLAHLARSSRPVELEAFTHVVRQDESGDSCFLLVQGTAEVIRNGRRIAELHQGAVFGELSLIDGGTRTADVVLRSRGELLEVTRRGFDELLDASPKVARAIMQQLAARIRELDTVAFG